MSKILINSVNFNNYTRHGWMGTSSELSQLLTWTRICLEWKYGMENESGRSPTSRDGFRRMFRLHCPLCFVCLSICLEIDLNSKLSALYVLELIVLYVEDISAQLLRAKSISRSFKRIYPIPSAGQEIPFHLWNMKIRTVFARHRLTLYWDVWMYVHLITNKLYSLNCCSDSHTLYYWTTEPRK